MAGYGTAFFGEETYAGEPSSVTPVFTGTHFPELLFEESFLTAPLSATPAFVDLGQNCLRAFRCGGGKSSELDRQAATTADFVVDCRDRDLDPNNADGPYYPYVIPNRRVRLRAIADGVTYPVFDGHADAHNVGYEIPADAVCDLPATDGFKLLARARLDEFGARNIEHSSSRVIAILDEIGWPAARRSISLGTAMLAATTGPDASDGYYRNRFALDALLEIDGTENGRMFIDSDGTFVFLSRNSIQTATRQTTPQLVFGDNAANGEIPYQTITIENSDTLVRSKVAISNPNFDDDVVVSSAVSITDHGELTYTRTVIDATEAAMHATADFILAQYKQPKSRVLGVTIPTSRPTSTYPTGLYAPMLSLRFGDRVTVIRRPPGGGDPIEQDCFVEYRTHKADARTRFWSTELGFSFAPDSSSYGLWDSAEWSTDEWGY